MESKNLLDDDNDGCLFRSFRMGNVDIHLDIVCALEGLQTDIKAIRACLHIRCFHRGNGECEPGANQSGDQCPS